MRTRRRSERADPDTPAVPAAPEAVIREHPASNSALTSLLSGGAVAALPFRAEMEASFGENFSGVRVRTGQDRALDGLGAAAATDGQQVVLRAGEPQRRVVAHELAHLVQQRRHGPAGAHDRVSRPEDAAEREAETAGRSAALGGAVRVAQRPSAGIHRDPWDDVATLVVRMLHLAQQQRVSALIQSGRAVAPDPARGLFDLDNLFHNSCEWLAANQCAVVVLSRTHDADTRQPPDVAYFDPRVRYPAVGGSYPADPLVVTDPGLQYEDANTLGGMTPQGLLLEILNPAAASDADLKALIIHEVQHDADQTWPAQRWADPAGADFNDYQSEFRSYWLERGEHGPGDAFGSSANPAANMTEVSDTDPASGVVLTATTAFANERQEAIFWHLVDAGYDYVPRSYTQLPSFKAMVDALAGPSGGNLVNSVRIQSLSEALDRCDSAMEPVDPAVQLMFAAADALDDLDRHFLRDETMAASFWAQVASHVSPTVHDMLHNTVWFRTRQPWGDFPLPADQATFHA